MPIFIKQMLIVLVLVLLGFCGSLAIKRISMNNQPYLVREMVVNLNLDEAHYYSFIIIINRCDGGCNIIEGSFSIIYIPNNIEDMYLKYLISSKG